MKQVRNINACFGIFAIIPNHRLSHKFIDNTRYLQYHTEWEIFKRKIRY